MIYQIVVILTNQRISPASSSSGPTRQKETSLLVEERKTSKEGGTRAKPRLTSRPQPTRTRRPARCLVLRSRSIASALPNRTCTACTWTNHASGQPPPQTSKYSDRNGTSRWDGNASGARGVLTGAPRASDDILGGGFLAVALQGGLLPTGAFGLGGADTGLGGATAGGRFGHRGCLVVIVDWDL